MESLKTASNENYNQYEKKKNTSYSLSLPSHGSLANLKGMDSMQKNYSKLSLDMQLLSHKAKASHITNSPHKLFQQSPPPTFFPPSEQIPP